MNHETQRRRSRLPELARGAATNDMDGEASASGRAVCALRARRLGRASRASSRVGRRRPRGGGLNGRAREGGSECHCGGTCAGHVVRRGGMGGTSIRTPRVFARARRAAGYRTPTQCAPALAVASGLKSERDAARGARAIGLLRKHSPLGFPAAHPRTFAVHPAADFSVSLPLDAAERAYRCTYVRPSPALQCSPSLPTDPARSHSSRALAVLGAAKKKTHAGSSLPGWASPDANTHARPSVRGRSATARGACATPVPPGVLDGQCALPMAC